MKYCFFFVFLFSSIWGITAQEQNKQDLTLSEYFGGVVPFREKSSVGYPYEYYKQIAYARSFIDTSDYYKAIEVYGSLRDTYGDTIDVLLGYGEAYYRLGDSRTSKSFFQKASKNGLFFQYRIWSVAYYRLASISYDEGNKQDFIAFLASIIEKNQVSDRSMVSITLTQGLDTMLSYFKLMPTYAYEAYRELGVYFILEDEQIEKGFMYLATSLAMMVQWGIRDVISSYDQSFTFSTLQNFIDELLKSRKGKNFLRNVEFMRILYAMKQYFHSQKDKNIGRGGLIQNDKYIQMLLVMLDNQSIFISTNKDSVAYYPLIRLK